MISIIIPTHNREKLLGETLRYVREQSYENWECIIVDDGSQDNTKNLVASFNENRFIYIYIEKHGRSHARNVGLEAAKGKYIQFLDSDDLILESKLQKSVTNLSQENFEFKRIAITNFECFSGSIEHILPAYSDLSKVCFEFDSILYGWYFNFTIPIHCGLFDSRLLSNFRFPEHLSQWEDWFLWLHVFQQKDIAISFIDEVLVLCRLREEKTKSKGLRVNLPEVKVLETLKGRISEKDRAEYYLKLIQKKNKQLDQLKTSINNYKQTRTFKVSTYLKNLLRYNSGS